MKRLLCTLALLLAYWGLWSQLTPVQRQGILDFQAAVVNHARESVVQNAHYPFRRPAPLPAIVNKEEFGRRWDEVFNDSLVKVIGQGKLSDWEAMGSQGILFMDGLVWLDLEGNLLAVNQLSAVEYERINGLVAAERAAVYEGLRGFERLEFVFEGEGFHGRLYQWADGGYRVAGWPKGAAVSGAPVLDFAGGTVVMDGSGGNHRYSFQKGGLDLELAVVELGMEGMDLIFTLRDQGRVVAKLEGHREQ